MDHSKVWKILKEKGLPDHLTIQISLYADQEAIVRTRHGTTDWFQIGKGIHQGYTYHHPYLPYMQSTSCEMPDWMKQKLNHVCWEKHQQPQICR